MRGLWREADWRVDGADLVLPSGQRIGLGEIRAWREQLLSGNADLGGKWCGWRVRQQWLIPPGGSLRGWRLSEGYARHLAQAEHVQRREVCRRQLCLF